MVNLTSNEKDESYSKYNVLTKYGLPKENIFIERDHFISLYNMRFRIPFWTIEHLTPDMMEGKKTAKRKNEFKIDELVPELFRSTPKDYLKSGYDKGHLASAENYRYSQESMDQTFYMSNIAPQEKSINRGIWRILENRARNFTKIYSNVYVMSGCLFLRGPNGSIEIHFLPESHIVRPTHYFKVILGEVDEELCDIESYSIPNRPQLGSPIIEKFLISKNELECVAGFLIFERVGKFRHTNDTTAFNQLLSSARLAITENEEVLSSTMPSSSV